METFYPHASAGSASASASASASSFTAGSASTHPHAPAHAPAHAASSSAAASSAASPPNSPPILPGTRTSSRAFQHASGSPPSTPPPRPRNRSSKGKQPVRPRRSPRRDPASAAAASFFAEHQQHAAGIGSDPRHSHGLSWNSTTRDSVVDNLLFSLDNLSRGDVDNMDGHEDEERHRYLSSLASQFSLTKSAQRSRGHTHSSSASDFTVDSPAKSPASSKGRRSNSGSTFGIQHSLTGRAKPTARINGIGRNSTDTQKPRDSSSALGHHTSDAGSLNYGYSSVLEPSRLAFGGRSMSLDQIQGQQEGSSVLERGRPVPSVHSKYDANDELDGAAPDPIIAAGPRKMQNPTATGPVFVGAAPSKQKPSTLRKTTTQTDLRSQAAPSPPITQEIRNQAAEFVRTSSMRGGMAPPASAQNSVAPSPGISVRRRDFSPPREKPGFFKRVFGGGSARAVSTPVERPAVKPVQHDPNNRTNAPNRSTSQTSAGPQSSGDIRQTTPAPAPQTLNKKPSSFFRRRKKSTSEAFQPPPLPVSFAANANLTVKKAEPSPSISSLRKVMDPFLTQDARPTTNAGSGLKDDVSRPNTRGSAAEDSEDPDIFHSGYTPPPDASLGARNPLSRDGDSISNLDAKISKRRPDALATSGSQDLSHSTDLQDLGRDLSPVTVRGQINDQPQVSPLSDIHPKSRDTDAAVSSRPSTGEHIIASRENSPVDPSQLMRDFSAGTNVSLNMNEDGWYVRPHPVAERPPSKKSERLVLQPTASEERLNINKDELSPIEGSSSSARGNSESSGNTQRQGSEFEQYSSAVSLLLPTLTVNSGGLSPKSSDPTIIRVPSPLIEDGAEYKERARKIYEGDEEDVSTMDAASWLGERNTLSTKTLTAYMKLFDFAGLNLLSTLRMLCSKLTLRGETQQVDRIITALSARWCECNPNHGFKAQDVVHTIFYSLILLNTDQHLADIEEKMSRSAYVKNTLPTIKRVVQDAAPDAFDTTVRATPTQLRSSIPWMDSNSSTPTSPVPVTPDASADRPDSSALDQLSAVNVNLRRLSIRPPTVRADSDNATPDSATFGASNALVMNPWTGTLRGWEVEMEGVLKSFFNSIRSDPLPLHGAVMSDVMGNRNLSVVDLNNNLKRTGSVVSKASDNMSYRSKSDFRSMTMRWQNRNNRSRPKLYPPSTVGSSRTSFDDGSSFWSPAMSSKYSFSKTLTSASMGSLSNPFSPVDSFKHSIGFANALSQAIIREETTGGEGDSFSMPGGLLEDESLALEGAPWAKEGLVKHKHHLETPDRKAKDRNWSDCFAVLSKGKLTLFAFNTSTKTQSLGRKTHFGKSGKAASVTSTRVGGGDWMENAEQLDVFILRQTIASTLPPPGYSKARPHVWALSLPSGAVHLFQVGTPEIAEEFMSTANYWSARLSKEPLSGGVSNIEYGWSEQVINPALIERSEAVSSPPPSMANRGHTHSMSTDRNGRTSLQSSLRSSFDNGFGNTKVRLPGDKVMIHEWHPPTQSMMASQLMEVDQLRQLTAYVQASEDELQKHNELKHPIELAFSPRHPNHNKAIINWQRKSDYLLREIVKFRTYIDSLAAAQKSKETFYAKKAEGRLSPVAKDDDVFDLPGIENKMLGIAPRVIHTSG